MMMQMLWKGVVENGDGEVKFESINELVGKRE
jgi:hypothetical protein